MGNIDARHLPLHYDTGLLRARGGGHFADITTCWKVGSQDVGGQFLAVDGGQHTIFEHIADRTFDIEMLL